MGNLKIYDTIGKALSDGGEGVKCIRVNDSYNIILPITEETSVHADPNNPHTVTISARSKKPMTLTIHGGEPDETSIG